MGRILEHHAKDLLQQVGVPVPSRRVARSPEEAGQAALALGDRVVVKALVPVGRRARSGAVVLAENPTQAAEVATRLLQQKVGDYPITTVLVERVVAAERELYFAVLLDKDQQVPVAMASMMGGIEVEEMLTRHPGELRSVQLDAWGRTMPHQLKELWASAGVEGELLVELGELSYRAVRLFYDISATLVEINPIAVSKPKAFEGDSLGVRDRPSVVALSAAISVDDNALSRHPHLTEIAQRGTDRLWRPSTALEQEALAVAARDPHRGTVRFIQLDGDIGFLCGGGGGSLVFFDGLLRAGGRPACYSEFGGNPTAEKTRGLARVVLSCPGVRGFLVGHNITNNTQVNLVAEGVVAALEDMARDPREFPVVAREVGTHDVQGRAILERAGVECLGEDVTMEQAALRIVERISGRS